MRALEIITGHVIYNLAYTYKFQLKTTQGTQGEEFENDPKTCLHNTWMVPNLNLEDREKIDLFLLKKNNR